MLYDQVVFIFNPTLIYVVFTFIVVVFYTYFHSSLLFFVLSFHSLAQFSCTFAQERIFYWTTLRTADGQICLAQFELRPKGIWCLLEKYISVNGQYGN